MLVVTAYPMIRAIYLSLFQYRATAPDDRAFIGIDNYVTVLTDSLWWQDIFNTVLIMVVTVAVELVIGFAFAYVMWKIIFARGVIRTSILIPYGIITVVSAFAWQFAFSLNNGFVNGWLPFVGDDYNWFGGRWSALTAICVSEIWKTTPFMSLLLLAGLSQISGDMVEAAKVDGAVVVAAALQGDPAEHEGGDHGRGPVQGPRRVPDLRQHLHHDQGRAGHRVRVLPHLPAGHRAVRARHRIGAVGAAVPVGPADRLPPDQAVPGRPGGRETGGADAAGLEHRR